MTTQLRAYAVGAAFSVRDVADELRWRPTDRFWTDVYYGRPTSRPTQPTSDNGRRPRRAAGAVSTRTDPSRIRTADQRKSAGQRVCNSW